MKKFITLTVALATITTSLIAAPRTIFDDERAIKYSELPTAAQEFIAEHFDKEQVSYTMLEDDIFRKEYKVVMSNGTKIEFDGDGAWNQVDCRYTSVPTAIVPAKIAEYVTKNYPEAKITELKRESHEWEVQLTGGLELTFNRDFKLTDIDD